MTAFSPALLRRLTLFLVTLWLCFALGPAAHAQSFRFTLRAEPDVIPANGISTASIFVQVPQDRSSITATPLVRFATTAGVIESQAMLTGGVARVLLRSSTTAGTAVVTAFIGSSREVTTVEFSEDNGIAQRYLEISAPYVAYGADSSMITASGKAGFDFGDTHIESDVRLDVDLYTERVWAEGTKGGVLIRQGVGGKSKQLHGDRLFYDMRRKRGVIRRADISTEGPARQEFAGNDFAPPPDTLDVPAPAGITPATPGTSAAPGQSAPDKSTADNAAPGVSGQSVAPPLSPSPSKLLEDDKDRGSGLVVPPAPSAAPDAGQSKPTGAVIPPVVIGGAVNSDSTKTGATKIDAAKTDTSNANSAAPESLAAQIRNSATPAVAANAAPVGIEIPVGIASTVAEGAPAESASTESISTVAPGSLADTPKAPQGEATQSTALVSAPRPPVDGGTAAPANVPAYSQLPAENGPTPRIVELPPPHYNAAQGYWVTARRLRVFPRDKVQFERASIFFNGKKAFGVPLYVLPLDGSFNPTTDMLAFNSQGGLSLKIPFYYQASQQGTGAVYLKREPGAGFSTEPGGVSLAIDQQYWLSPRSHGKFTVDQIGQGAWNLNYEHDIQFSPDTTGSFFLNMPRHQDIYGRASVTKEMRTMQIGFEGFYDQPEGEQDNERGQFFARMRPKALGKSGWSYTASANALAVRRISSLVDLSNGSGGINIGGSANGGAGGTMTLTHSLFGQTVSSSLQSPLFTPWRGSGFTTNFLVTAFNYSDGRRGFAPGVNLGFSQKMGTAALRLDYTYDRSNLGLYGLTSQSFTNYVSGTLSAQLGKKIGVSTFLSRSFSDGSTYGNSNLDYYFSAKWRAGLYADYSNFTTDSQIIYGWSLGRAIGTREVSLNYDTNRGRVYVELGNGRY